MKTKLKLTAVFEEAEDGGYIAFIEELPGVNTQGDTLEESKTNLLEALEMVLQSQREISEKNFSTVRSSGSSWSLLREIDRLHPAFEIKQLLLAS